jgi:hypothetical protein
MMAEQLMHPVSRFGLLGALLVAAAALPACGQVDSELEDEDVEEAELAVGDPGGNNWEPWSAVNFPFARDKTDDAGVTTEATPMNPGNPDPIQLCKGDTVTSTGCTLKLEWNNWLNVDATNRAPAMKALAKCAVESSFTIQTPGGALSFPGQWGLYPGWKSNRLNGQDKRERMSSCMLSLLNGNDLTLQLCIVGPGGAPFSDPCESPLLTVREGGFFGDLFAANPTAYVAGPDTAVPPTNGRTCFGAQGNYCCAEEDTNCQGIVLAGAIVGSPEQNFANKRCNQPLVSSGGNQYCPSFFSTREPGRSYVNVFTTFIPPPQ